ncbi:hypothetical protein FOA52_004679 [Chlamydomonas sp. UWO 241]|nr:hypothetical protein FOA52_004679 [Chlamydomonas sp. UWO 241]
MASGECGHPIIFNVVAANPDCTFSFDFMGNYAYSCTRLVVYHFSSLSTTHHPSQECHQSYQTEWEKINPACKLYMTNSLGEDSNRDESDPPMATAGAAMPAEDPAMAAWTEFLNTTNGTKGALFFANATGNVTDAAPPCFGEGLYHLSCYSANLNLTDIGKAKLECLTAWMEANPNCTFSIDLMGKYSYGCGKFAVYHFPLLECHQSYQKDWEKINPACKLYTSSGLGDDSNRDESIAAMTDYMCALPTSPA